MGRIKIVYVPQTPRKYELQRTESCTHYTPYPCKMIKKNSQNFQFSRTRMCVETWECQEIMEAGGIIRPSQYCTRVGLPENFFLNFSSLRNIFGFFPWIRIRHHTVSSRIELLNQLFQADIRTIIESGS